jgi:hypothetical protein
MSIEFVGLGTDHTSDLIKVCSDNFLGELGHSDKVSICIRVRDWFVDLSHKPVLDFGQHHVLSFTLLDRHADVSLMVKELIRTRKRILRRALLQKTVSAQAIGQFMAMPLRKKLSFLRTAASQVIGN